MGLTEQVEAVILNKKLFRQGERIVVAVSGGPDSTALLHLLFLLSSRWNWTLVAAHANHGFRPSESLLEADFVRKLTLEWAIPFVYRELNVPAFLEQYGGNAQNAARELRYSFLEETARQQGASTVALAHHADDQAETVLMRIIRGAGVAGLAGMTHSRPFKGVELVRPLLGISKNQLLEHLRQEGISYCTDSSNEKPHYIRNRIRLEAIPYLSRYNPSIEKSLNRLAELASCDNDYMDLQASNAMHQLADFREGQVRFALSGYRSLHLALQRRFIKLILNYLSAYMELQDFGAVELVRSSLQQNDRPNINLRITADISLIREYDEVRLIRSTGSGEDEACSYLYSIDSAAGQVYIPEASSFFTYEVKDADGMFLQQCSPDTACFDAAALSFPLVIRNRRAGDRIAVDGLNGSKKVKDIYIDNKVPSSQRRRLPILTDAEGSLLWIPGLRRSCLARITAGTSQLFWIHCQSQFDKKYLM